MDRRAGTCRRYWFLLPSLVLMACASTPRVSESRFTQEYFSSRDGRLRYRSPVGWLHATNDAPSSDNLIWLVRGDYAATLGVREVRIDAETRQEINRAGLKRVAELTLALASSENGLSVAMPPTLSVLGGTEVCTYEYTTGHPGDRVRIVLVDSGKKIFEVRLLVTGKVGEESLADLVLLEEAFVKNVLW